MLEKESPTCPYPESDERSLRPQIIQGAYKLSEEARQPFPSNTGLRFSREMAVATIGPFQMLRSLCVCNRHEFHDLVTLPTQVMA